MANQLKTKFIGNDQVTSEKVLLANDTALRAKDSSDVTQDILKLDATDKIIVYRSSGPEELAYQSDIAAVTGDFVLDAGDTMSGSLIIDGSTAPAPAPADLKVANHLNNTQQMTVGYNSISANDNMTIAANGGLGELTITASEINANGTLNVSNYLIRPNDTAGEGFIQFPAADENVLISGGTGDIRFTAPQGKMQFGDSSSSLYVDPQLAQIKNVSMLQGVGTIDQPSLSFVPVSNDIMMSTPNADIYISANGGGNQTVITSDFVFIGNGDTDGQANPLISVNMNGTVNMSQNELLNASKLEVKDDSSIVALDVKKQYLNFQNASSNSLLFVDRENLFSNTSFIGSIDGTKNASFTSVFQTGIFEGSTITAQDTASTLDSKVEATITAGSPQAKMLASSATESGSMTIVPASASVAVSDATYSANYEFSPTSLDMDGKKIVDLPLPDGVGQPLIYDQLGAANGVATLDANQKVPASQLPNSVMEYQGVWNASSNTPTLANGAGNADIDIGNVYRVNSAGTVDFGAGNIDFLVGDYVILNSSKIWERSHTADVDPRFEDIEDDVSHLVTLSGMPVDSDNFGTFTGSTIGSNKTAKQAFQALETAHEEVDQNANDLITLSGVAENSTDFGSFTGTTIGANKTAKQALQALETAHEEVDQNANDLITLSGVAENSTDFGSFTGTTIGANKTAKQAFQALETAHEAHLNDTVDAHDASAISLSPAINSQTDVQSAMGDHETRIDALEAVVYAAPYKKTLVAGDITNGYIDLPFLAVQTDGMRVCVDRLQMHQGSSEDYSLSVVGGVTRITFLNDMVSPGPQQLSSGDNIYVVYQKNA